MRWYHDWYRLDHIAFYCTHNDRRFFAFDLGFTSPSSRHASSSSLSIFSGLCVFGITHRIVLFSLGYWVGHFELWECLELPFSLLFIFRERKAAKGSFSFVCISRVD